MGCRNSYEENQDETSASAKCRSIETQTDESMILTGLTHPSKIEREPGQEERDNHSYLDQEEKEERRQDSQSTIDQGYDQLKKEDTTVQEEEIESRGPGYDQLKREGVPDQSFRMTSKNKIENFFVGEYYDIIESQLKANNDNDFQTDETLTKNIKECYDMVKRATIDEMCTQIYELFTYDPQKTLSSKEEERLLDISHAYGLLLYHYRKQYPNFEHIKRKCKQLQEDKLIENFDLLFLDMVTISPPFVLFVPEQFDLTKAQEFVDCNCKKTHPFHVRRPVILNNYLGTTCVSGLICKGVNTAINTDDM